MYMYNVVHLASQFIIHFLSIELKLIDFAPQLISITLATAMNMLSKMPFRVIIFNYIFI